jgi:hypothetical protein
VSLLPIVSPGTDVWQSVNAIVGATVTLNSSDKNARMSLSGSDLIVTHDASSNHALVRATHAISSGKAYYEVTIASAGSGNVNIGGWQSGTLATSDGNYLGSGGGLAQGWGYSTTGHNIYYQGLGAPRGGYTAAAMPNGTYGWAYDARGGHFWLRNNDGTWLIGNPATGALPIQSITGTKVALYPGCSHYNSSATWTYNFGATSFSHSLPN